MNVVALVDFHDNLRGVDRKAGEEFVVTKERFEEINSKAADSWYGKPFVKESVRTVEAKGVQTPEARKKATRRRKAQ